MQKSALMSSFKFPISVVSAFTQLHFFTYELEISEQLSPISSQGRIVGTISKLLISRLEVSSIINSTKLFQNIF